MVAAFHRKLREGVIRPAAYSALLQPSATAAAEFEGERGAGALWRYANSKSPDGDPGLAAISLYLQKYSRQGLG
jgi:hypothetical protein